MVTTRCTWILIIAWFVSINWVDGASAPSTSTSKSQASYPPLHGLQPDSWVQAAPLVVAMACRDGVAIVAAASTPHLSTSLSHDDEPLRYYRVDDETDPSKNATTPVVQAGSDADNHDNSCSFLDLPDSYTGPYRIQSIGKIGATAFVSCGWKADGYIRLLNAARDLASAERDTYGEECNPILPHQLSLFMAQCAVSERFRPLSCAALIGYMSDNERITASSSYKGQNSEFEVSTQSGCLWLVDVTGAYPVRAHCMGGGEVSITAESASENNARKESSTVPVADVVNEELLAILRKSNMSQHDSTMPQRLPYFNMTTDEALKMIVKLLSSKKPKINTPSGRLLPHGIRLEIASLNCKSQYPRLIHRRVSNFLYQRKEKTVVNSK